MKRKFKVLIFFLCSMLFFTILSRITTNYLTAEVNVVRTEPMNLEYINNFEGWVEGKNSEVYLLPKEIFIENMYISKGDSVKKGEPIFSVVSLELDVKLEKLTLEIDKLNYELEQKINNINNNIQKTDLEIQYLKINYESSENSDSEKNKELQLANQELANLYEQLNGNFIEYIEIENLLKEKNIYEEIKNNNYSILSSFSGVISDINVEIGKETNGNENCVYFNDQNQLIFKGKIEADKINNYKLEQKVTVQDLDNNQYLNGEFLVNRIRKFTQENDDMYYIEIDIPESNKIINNFSNYLVDATKYSKKYNDCIPINSLRIDSNNNYYVLYIDYEESILGKRMIARKKVVSIEEKNSEYAALKSGESLNDLEIIMKNERNLNDGDKVRKIDE